MFYKVLRFFGAIIAALLFAYLVDAFHLAFFGGAVHFLANLSWGSLLGFDILRGFLLPVVWGVLWLIGMGLACLVRGSKVMAALPLVIFVLAVIADFRILFLEPIDLIVSDIGQGFWYYFGAILTFIGIVFFYGICAAFMLASDENLK
ncbi:MAG: hypothetical protein IJ914_04140 [Prevotella sp.]|nr:hypothetical protein [Prevotella sp.]